MAVIFCILGIWTYIRTFLISAPQRSKSECDAAAWSQPDRDLPNVCGEKYGRNRLLDVISSSGDDAQAAIHSIRQDVMAFTGETSLKADVAIAVLEYTPTGV